MAYDKNVYILGAGASVSSGAPVIRDFLDRARQLLDDPNSGLDKEERQAFRRVFEWRGGMSRVLTYVNLNLDDIEELFSLADMSYQLGAQEAKQVIDDLIILVSRTLELMIKFRVDKAMKTEKKDIRRRIHWQQTYERFVNVLEERNSQRVVSESELDCVITLNYDTALDQTFYALGIDFTYCHSDWLSGMNPQGHKLLKLHGSVNWGACCNPQCGYRKAEMDFFSPKPNEYIDRVVRDPTPNDFHTSGVITMVASKTLHRTLCPKCGKANLRPFIVPPTWNKAVHREGLNSVWEAARRELAQATRLIIIGYSLPATDTFFKYLLASGLSENESLRRIILADPASEDARDLLRKRYHGFINQFFVRDCKFVFWNGNFSGAIGSISEGDDRC